MGIFLWDDDIRQSNHTCDNPDCAASTDALHIPLNPIYKVVIGEDSADTIQGVSWDYLPYAIGDALAFRVSPIVVYTRLDERTAIELAQEPGVEVRRAPADWSI